MSSEHNKPVSGGQTISGLSSVVTLTIPAGANTALVQNTGTKNVRYWVDGTTPTNSTGMQLLPGATVELQQDEISGFKATEESASAAITVSYFKDM
jgi:hypothetical protein